MICSQPHPDGYEYEFACRPDFGYATVRLKANETIKVEASAMATMDTNIKMKTKMKGGLGRMFTGESLFVNEFTAENGPGEIGIAPGAPGDIEHVYLENETIYLQNSGFVAASPSLNVETKWQGLVKGFFGRDGLFLIKVSGTGSLFFSTYGAMIPIDVDGEQIVDNAYMVAFTEGLDYENRRIGGFRFEESMRRYYANPGRLVQVLGYTNADYIGCEGIERSLDEHLAGEDGNWVFAFPLLCVVWQVVGFCQ